MASNGAGNFYVIRQSGISHSAVESILVGLQQLHSNNVKKSSAKVLATGKALLGQLRVVSFFLSVFRNSLASGVRQGLLEILKACQENNDVDRKIFRTVLFILSDDLEHTTLSASTVDKALPIDTAEEAFLDYVAHEVANTTNITLKTVIVSRLVGTISALAQRRGYRDNHTAGLLRTYFNFLIDIQRQPTPQKKSMVLQAVGAAFSAMRRMGEVLPVESQTSLLEALRSGSLTLQRQSLALIVTTLAQADDLETRLSWSMWFRDVLKDPATNVAILKDGLASSYAVRISTVLVLKCGDNDSWPQEAIDLLVDTINLSTKAPLKFLTELITFITSPALAWRILPSLENKQAGLVSLLCNTLTAYVRNVSLEDIYLPVLLRACESMGRFLQQRPGFDAQHSHRVFSAHMVEKDGESLKALWIALRRLYRKAVAPKATAPTNPAVVRTIMALQSRGDSSVSNISPVYSQENWAYDTDNLAQTSQALPSPYIFSCLIRTLIWLAPDQRYCRKEHPILWHAFSEDLFSSWDVLSSPASSLCNIGDASNILQDLLAHLFSRVQSSMVVVELDRDHVDSSVHTTYYKCRLCCEPQYIYALCTLTTATIRHALSPAVITLLPAIWSFIFGFASSTTNWKNALTLTQIWEQELYTVILLMNECLTTQQAYRRQLVTSVREEALVYLIHATELKAKLHLLLYRQNEVDDNPLADENGDSTTSAASKNEFDDMFTATISPLSDKVVAREDKGDDSAKESPEKSKVSLDMIWKEVGWNKVYSFVRGQFEQHAVSDVFSSENEVNSYVKTTSSGVTMASGRFLLALCNISALFSKTNAPSSSKTTRVNNDIIRFLSNLQKSVISEVWANLVSSSTTIAEKQSHIEQILSLFPAYSSEYLLFSEVKDAMQVGSTLSQKRGDGIGMRNFSTALLMGIFGNANMSFEDVTPVIMSTLPSENVIETDFDVFDSTKANIGEARRSFMLGSTKLPSFTGSRGTTDGLDLFQASSSTSLIASSNKSMDSSDSNNDLFESFPTSSTANNESTVSGSAATSTSTQKRPSVGKGSLSIVGAPLNKSASSTPVKQSSNTVNTKLAQLTPPPFGSKFAVSSSINSKHSITETPTNTNLFGNDDLTALFPAATQPPTKPSSTEEAFSWDTSSFAATTAHADDTFDFEPSKIQPKQPQGHSVSFDDFLPTSVSGETTSTVATTSSTAASVSSPSVVTSHDLDLFTMPTTGSAMAPASATTSTATKTATVPKLQGPTPVLTALTPPRDSALPNKGKLQQQQDGKKAKPTLESVSTAQPSATAIDDFTFVASSSSTVNSGIAIHKTEQNDDFFASIPTVPTPSSFASSAPPSAIPSTTANGSSSFFGSDFEPVVINAAETKPSTTTSAISGGLLSASSAADLDFLGSIGSKATASPSVKPPSSTTSTSMKPSAASTKPLMPLPPPVLETNKKPAALSGVAAARRQSLGIGTQGKAVPPTTNVAAIFDGLVFDHTTTAVASSASANTSQPPPKPTFGDDWASNIRRTSLNGPPPVDPFAPTAPVGTSSSALSAAFAPTAAPSTTKSDDLFSPTVSSSSDGFAPTASSWATTTATNNTSFTPSAPIANPFAPTVSSAGVATAADFLPSQPAMSSTTGPNPADYGGFAPTTSTFTATAPSVPYGFPPGAAVGGYGGIMPTPYAAAPYPGYPPQPTPGMIPPAGYPAATAYGSAAQPAVGNMMYPAAGVGPQPHYPYPAAPVAGAAPYTNAPPAAAYPTVGAYPPSAYPPPQGVPFYPTPQGFPPQGLPPQQGFQGLPSANPTYPTGTSQAPTSKPKNPFDDFR